MFDLLIATTPNTDKTKGSNKVSFNLPYKKLQEAAETTAGGHFRRVGDRHGEGSL